MPRKHYRGTCLGQPFGNRAADALRRAGDDRDLPVEAPHTRDIMAD